MPYNDTIWRKNWLIVDGAERAADAVINQTNTIRQMRMAGAMTVHNYLRNLDQRQNETPT